jgi:hypothetical protein
MNEINKKWQSRYARCPEVRYRYSLPNRACVGVKILKHHLRSRLHLLVAYGFRLIQDCSKPIHIGRTTCFAAFPIYTWKHDQQKCEKGLYGGCHGSKNIFQTLEECQDIAGNICKSRK